MSATSFDAFAYAHAHRTEIAWLSQNTNHLVPPEVVGPALAAAIAERRYEGYPPAAGLPELQDAVRADLRLPPDYTVHVSAGATESLYMTARALLGPGEGALASDPSYLILHKFLSLGGGRVHALPIYEPPYRLTARAVQSAAGTDSVRMLVLIDPLNPLGSGYPREEVRALAEIARDHRWVLLHDVTYRDFADDPASAFEFAPERTVVIWSAAKNCGLAGLRIGGFAAPPDLARRILRFNTNDLGVSILSQVAALAALRTKSRWFGAVRAQTRENMARVRSAAEGVPGVRVPVYPSQANMFVLDIAETGATPEALQEELLVRHGVFVRAGNYLSERFGGRFVRVSFSNPPADIDRFVAAFPEAVAAVRSSGRAAESGTARASATK